MGQLVQATPRVEMRRRNAADGQWQAGRGGSGRGVLRRARAQIAKYKLQGRLLAVLC